MPVCRKRLAGAERRDMSDLKDKNEDMISEGTKETSGSQDKPEATAENRDFEYIREQIKSRPVNRGKLAKSTLISAVSALVFGLVACVAFFALAPLVSGYFEKDEEEEIPQGRVIIFPEETIEEETNPEDMLITSVPEAPPTVSADTDDPPPLSEEDLEKAISNVEFTVSDYQKLYQDLAAIASDARKSMVRVRTVKTDIDWFDNMFEETNEEPGLIIAENGVNLFVVTKYSGIKNTENVSIFVFFVNEMYVEATLQAYDLRTDLCVLSIPLNTIDETTRATYVIASLGTSNSSRLSGSPVIAVGSPMGNYGSLNYGIITSVNRDLTVTDHIYRQITTDIYGSSSANGVLINLRGEVLGIIDTKYSDKDTKNLICAIGISELKKTIEDMINGKELIYFGITGANVPESATYLYDAPRGAFVKTVEMDSPAMAGGIQAGDIIMAIDGKYVNNYSELVTEISNLESDKEIEVDVSRQSVDGYKTLTFTIIPEQLGGL